MLRALNVTAVCCSSLLVLASCSKEKAAPPAPRLSSGTFDAAHKVVSPNATSLDAFGFGLAMSDDKMAVLDEDTAYVFRREAGAWALDGTFGPSVLGTEATFTTISGDSLIVGINSLAPQTTRALAFRRVGPGNWVPDGFLDTGALSSGFDFGSVAAIDGDTVVMSGVNSDVNEAYVFRRLGDSNWSLEGTLLPDDSPEISVFFGTAVDVSGDRIIVGGAYEQPNGVVRGAVYVFDRMGPVWTQTRLPSPIESPWTGFGQTLALHDDTAVVGATVLGNGDGEPTGGAYVYEWDGSTWNETQLLQPATLGANDQFGQSIEINANLLAVSALAGQSPFQPQPFNTGDVYVFEPVLMDWVEAVRLINPEPRLPDSVDPYDGFSNDITGAVSDSAGSGGDTRALFNANLYGFRVALDGCRLGVSAIDGTDASAGLLNGAVYTYDELIPNSPPVAIDDTAVADGSGNALGIDVLGNDSDPEGDPLTVALVTPPVNGTATPNPDGTFDYQRIGTFNGTDAFTYSVSDGNEGVATATVVVEVFVEATVPNNVDLGDGVVLDPNATVRGGATIGDGAVIEDALVRADATVGAGTVVEDGANVGRRSEIGAGVTVGAGADVKRDATVGDGTTIGTGALIGVGVSIGQNVTIENDAEIRAGASVGNGSLIGAGALVRRGAVVGANVTVGAGATIARNAVVPDGTIIPPGATFT